LEVGSSMRRAPVELALIAVVALLLASRISAFPPATVIPASPLSSAQARPSGPEGKLAKPVTTKPSVLSRIGRWFGASKVRPPAAPGQPVGPNAAGRPTGSARAQPPGEGSQLTAYEFWALERDERSPRR
jgi:hypothetical protein